MIFYSISFIRSDTSTPVRIYVTKVAISNCKLFIDQSNRSTDTDLREDDAGIIVKTDKPTPARPPESDENIGVRPVRN